MTNATVRNNEFIDNNGYGVDVQGSGSGHVIEDNLIKGNGIGPTDQDAGIRVGSPPGGSTITIRTNTITTSVNDGIYVDSTWTNVLITQIRSSPTAIWAST